MKRLWSDMRWRIGIISVAVLLVIAISVAAHRGPDAVEVKTVVVKPATLTVKLPENGVLSRPQTTTIAASATGNITQIYAKEG
ncbi:MAG: hypothetical protein JO293_00520, partial [Candidatus Eremiobacteraeota bacterium]|nr:hypothetical protein [Candidatus Eremiobacteraeota bacterium]